MIKATQVAKRSIPGEPETMTSSTAAAQEPQAADAATLKRWLDRQAVTLVDVREPVERAGEHIPGSILVPWSNFEAGQVPDEGKQVVVYCQKGPRSAKAARQLLAGGWDPENVAFLRGGLEAWKAGGYETQVNKKAPLSLMRQVQIVAGSLVLTGTVLGAFVSPWFLLLSGFVGAGLTFAGLTNTCGLALWLSKVPDNQRIKS